MSRMKAHGRGLPCATPHSQFCTSSLDQGWVTLYRGLIFLDRFISAWMRGRTASRPMRPQTFVAWVGITPTSSHHLESYKFCRDISLDDPFCSAGLKPHLRAQGEARLRTIHGMNPLVAAELPRPSKRLNIPTSVALDHQPTAPYICTHLM
ncbi:hypothetical protein GGI35DRAFT_82293 [Trichoderma velutinum]